MSRILIRNARLVDADDTLEGDLLIEDGMIVKRGNLQATLPGDYFSFDASGMYVLPGGIDPHVHLALPTPAGNSCDDFLTGSEAALAGGTTYIMDFVTPRKGQSLMEALKLRRREAAQSVTGYGLHMGISEWNASIASEIVPCIRKEGIRSFKAYLAYRETIGINYRQLEEMMKIVGQVGGLVMVHCEDGEEISKLQAEFLQSGKTRPCYHPLARPAEGEVRAIEKVVELADITGCPAYIVHVSTGKGADAILAAKKNGIRVFAETCPHYLLLDESVYDPAKSDPEVLPYIFSPPARSKKDQDRLWKGLTDGTFDVVATDHCPFNTVGQKDRGLNDFTRIPNGAAGIMNRMRLLFTYGVQKRNLTLNRFVSLTSTRPAEIFGLGKQKGKLLPGYDADLVIWNPDARDIISAKNPLSHCDSDIFEGLSVRGGAESVMIGGEFRIMH